MRLNAIGARLTLAACIALAPIVLPASAHAQDCVRVVRSISDFTIRGDAWTWWAHAGVSYARAQQPAVGSVLVFKRTGRLHRGHVSLVSHVIDRRTIEVDHSWLDGRGLRRNMRVIDVSAHNDWSMVRVWHEPTEQIGLRAYATYGFILPHGARPRDVEPEPRMVVAPAGRSTHATVRMRMAALDRHHVPAVVPGHKPGVQTAGYQSVVAHAVLPARTVTPHRKPALPATVVADARPMRTLVPTRKPGTAAPMTEVASSER